MKITFKLITILMLAIILVNITLSTKVYALDSMIRAGREFLSSSTEEPIDRDQLNTVSRTIYNVFFAVAVGIAVIVGAYLGIKIMTGTVEEKAKIKEMLIPYIVGLFVIFATFTIWSLVVKFGTETFL